MICCLMVVPGVAYFQADHRLRVAPQPLHASRLFLQGVCFVTRTTAVDRVPVHADKQANRCPWASESGYLRSRTCFADQRVASGQLVSLPPYSAGLLVGLSAEPIPGVAPPPGRSGIPDPRSAAGRVNPANSTRLSSGRCSNRLYSLHALSTSARARDQFLPRIVHGHASGQQIDVWHLTLRHTAESARGAALHGRSNVAWATAKVHSARMTMT